MKYIFFFLVLLNIPLFSQVPTEFPPYTITVNNNPSDGQLFFTPYSNKKGHYYSPFLVIMNNDGMPQYLKPMSKNVYDFKRQPNNNYTYYDDSTNMFYEMNPFYNIIDSFYINTPNIGTDVHDLLLLPNGNSLLLGFDNRVVDMSRIVSGGDTNAIVIGLIIQELNANKDIIFQWTSWDHFNITDAASDINLLDSVIDYVHVNSIALDNDSNIIISSRHMDEITKINRTTGEVMWRLGGENNQFTFINDTIGFSHQHSARMLPNGHLILFDNGNLHNPRISRAVEYALDQVNKTAELVWEYKNNPVIFSRAMGSVQRLENGNTLICWGANATNNVRITEVNSAKEKVFELEMPYSITYRAFRFNRLTDVEDYNPIASSSFSLSQNFPNPFNPSTTIKYSVPFESMVNVSVYNALGERVQNLVSEIKAKGEYQANINLSDYSSGIYFCSITASSSNGRENFRSTKKMMLLK